MDSGRERGKEERRGQGGEEGLVERLEGWGEREDEGRREKEGEGEEG